MPKHIIITIMYHYSRRVLILPALLSRHQKWDRAHVKMTLSELMKFYRRSNSHILHYGMIAIKLEYLLEAQIPTVNKVKNLDVQSHVVLFPYELLYGEQEPNVVRGCY